jgi:sulfatase modifying factor 1
MLPSPPVAVAQPKAEFSVPVHSRPSSSEPKPSESTSKLLRTVAKFKDCAVCPEMVVIPAGTFDMGSPISEQGRQESEGPVHRLSPKQFALGKSPVTRGQLAAFMKEVGDDFL